MKRRFTLMALSLAMVMAALAQEKNIKVVSLSTDIFGKTNLRSELSKDRYEIDSLVVIGNRTKLTEEDILFIGDCCKNGRLTGIDLSRCYYVENNRIPTWAFASDRVNAKPRKTEGTGDGEKDTYHTNLRYITLSNGITEICDYAFAYTNLEAITLPHWLKTIGNGAFAGCPNLKTVIIRGEEDKSQTAAVFDVHPSDAVLKVAPGLGERYRNSELWDDFNIVESEDAFRVVEVDVADGQTLADALGSDNMKADSLRLSGKLGIGDLELLKDNTMYGQLVGLDLSDCVIDEEGTMFSGKFNTVRMPRQMTKIPHGFLSYSKVDHLIMPESYEAICCTAFEGCTGFADSTLVIPEGCRRLGYRAFSDCRSLKRLVLPSSLDVLEEASLDFNWSWTAYGVMVVTDVYVNRMYPPLLSTAREEHPDVSTVEGCGPFGCPRGGRDNFGCTTKYWTLYVPVGAKKNYEADDYWNHFRTIIETPLLTGEPTGIGGTSVAVESCAADGVYTLDGRIVAKDTQSALLSKGLYIVKKNGVARKMLIGR